MPFNLTVIALTALVPLIMGFIWYNPKVFGNAWMREAGVTKESMEGANMAKIFGLTYVLSFLIALGLQAIVIHQMAFYSLFADDPAAMDPNSPSGQALQGLLDTYGSKFRTFGHGAFHGLFYSVLFALPIIAINSLFERKSGKYILINWGFWALCMYLMGGLICQFN